MRKPAVDLNKKSIFLENKNLSVPQARRSHGATPVPSRRGAKIHRGERGGAKIWVKRLLTERGKKYF